MDIIPILGENTKVEKYLAKKKKKEGGACVCVKDK